LIRDGWREWKLSRQPFEVSKGFMRFTYSVVLALGLALSAAAQDAGQQAIPKSGGDFSNVTVPLVKVPEGVILVKGAWASASDSVTPVPEGASVNNEAFSAPYFGMTYQLPSGWTQKYQGPPPSETGRYVLAQLSPAATSNGTARGSILIAAQDMFFTPLPARNAAELIHYMSEHLQADYQSESPPAEARIAGRDFTVFAYWSPVAELHWYVLATEIRCHTVQFVLTSRDTKLLEALVRSIDKMTPPAEASPTGGAVGGPVPVCIANYARDENMTFRTEPVFTERRFNAIPVRIVIDKEGYVKHIHFLSAFPDQSKAITDALSQWRFKPHQRNGERVEVETGVLFGRQPAAGPAQD
jgi:hypothetical protein